MLLLIGFASPAVQATEPLTREDKQITAQFQSTDGTQPDRVATYDAEHASYVAYQGLLRSLVRQDAAGIKAFLPVYQALKEADPAIIRWATAVQAWHTGQYRQAIKEYRWLIAHYPDNEIIRLQLAIALFDHQDNEVAEQQLQKLRSGQQIPLIEKVIEGYLSQIRQRNFWSLTSSLSYVSERNINNAPPPGTQLNGWKPALPESATGFSYGLDAEKSWSFANNIFSEYRFSGYGNRFWNNHKYDELTVRNSLGLGYRTSDIKLLFMPFLEYRWYGGGSAGHAASQSGLQRYANMTGIRAESRYQLTTHWLLYAQGEYGTVRYNKKTYLEGDESAFSVMAVVFPLPNHYWFIRGSYDQQTTRYLEDSYHRYAFRAGWGYEWHYGISTQLQMGYGRKHYQGKDIFGVLQRNHEYNVVMTLWHRGLYFWGVTPKISWIYQKTQSNHPFYTFDKQRVLFSFSKAF